MNPEIIDKLAESPFKIPAKLAKGTANAEKIFPFKATKYYMSLADEKKIASDPVARQIIPDTRETDDLARQDSKCTYDPLDEERQMPVPRLIHRYADRALLITTNTCAVHCRFCMRKRIWSNGAKKSVISSDELDNVCEYLAKKPKIHEILISGGDPLTLPNRKISQILSRISQIKSIEIIRVGSRIPVVMPSRIDDRLVHILAKSQNLWMATHFNHPRELTPQALKACSKLVRKGVPMVNQTVLLKDINDSPDTLEELFLKLARNRIKPLYLFHVDPVTGNSHFATGIEKGIQIIKELRNRISSIATPVFAFDLPHGGGKIQLMPNYSTPHGFEALDGSYIQYPKINPCHFRWPNSRRSN
ncbi:MAG: KamA family radical SAM protein [Victivallales bacterium]|nr:KamA family radical SAM protein [Victivallales bacterium]